MAKLAKSLSAINQGDDDWQGERAWRALHLNCGLFIEGFRRTGGDEALIFIVALMVLPLILIVSVAYALVTWAILPLVSRARVQKGRG